MFFYSKWNKLYDFQGHDRQKQLRWFVGRILYKINSRIWIDSQILDLSGPDTNLFYWVQQHNGFQRIKEILHKVI